MVEKPSIAKQVQVPIGIENECLGGALPKEPQVHKADPRLLRERFDYCEARRRRPKAKESRTDGVVTGFTIKKGSGWYPDSWRRGGGIALVGSSATIEGNIITQDFSNFGGAV